MQIQIPTYFWVLLHFTLVAFAIFHALLYKRDTRSATGWIMISFFVPFMGAIAYYLFGINRVKSRALNIRRGLFKVAYEIGEQKIIPFCTGETNLLDTGLRITGRLASSNNNVQPYFTGKSAYEAMLDAIHSSKNSIFLSTYILNLDQTGKNFVAALEQAVHRGVNVLVLIDGVGELYSKERITKILQKKKIKTTRFLPPKLIPPSVYINLRNHRKLLIVDNEIAFAGGMNISDEHTSVVKGNDAISDVHFRLTGNVVNELIELFERDWIFSKGESMPFELNQTPLENNLSNMLCRVIPDGPDAELDTLALTIQAVISSAARSVLVVTPYFIPSREIIAALQVASLRGVAVTIVLPGKNNLFFMHWANRNVLTELLKWGVKVYYQPAPFAHTKLLLIDSDYTLMGSANIDPRSLRLNFELGVEIFSEALNSQLNVYMQNIISKSRAVTFDELANRSQIIRLRDSFFALFSPYL